MSDMAATTTSSPSTSTLTSTSTTPGKVTSEFDPNYKPVYERPTYSWVNSAKDWYRQSWIGPVSERKAEDGLLSLLPFYPQPDSTRVAKIINTPIDNKNNYIHEFYIENTQPPVDTLKPMDVILIHGYAAALGLFIDNFDSLSSIPGVKIHAIDLLGFGLSSRPNFPNFDGEKKEDIIKTEDWFIDSLEKWRIERGINQFVLMGHSFGGYLSSIYALKHNKKITTPDGKSGNMIDKLVLISPVGVERNKYSFLKDLDESNIISPQQQSIENSQDPKLSIEEEFTKNQESIVHGNDYDPVSKLSNSRRIQFIKKLWTNNVSPFSIVRNVGPFKSKMISSWTTMRFAHVYAQDPKKFQKVHDYIYRIFNSKGSGEYALTRVLAFGAVAKLPLMDRCPQPFAKMNLPTLWLYGDRDWMNEAAGLEMTKEINNLSSKKLAEFKLIPDAGHHLYLDNPSGFISEIFKFLNY